MKSKTLLFAVLDEFFQTTEYSQKQLSARGLSNEVFEKCAHTDGCGIAMHVFAVATKTSRASHAPDRHPA